MESAFYSCLSLSRDFFYFFQTMEMVLFKNSLKLINESTPKRDNFHKMEFFR